MVVGFTTTHAISAYHHCCEFEPRPWQGVLDTTIYDKVCQWLATGWWFSPARYTEILLKVALNTIKQTKPSNYWGLSNTQFTQNWRNLKTILRDQYSVWVILIKIRCLLYLFLHFFLWRYTNMEQHLILISLHWSQPSSS